MSEVESSGHTGEPWSDSDVQELRGLVDKNTPTRLIGLKLEKTEVAVQDKLRELGLSLAPSNWPPYGDLRSHTRTLTR
ncbi:hypothetical protein [Kribbella sp. CA-293567]|uniref:hypothetical protein n=1 Tax=Kribbella sp. CA-293567 TaxID=3002436 RepID=UPI0022DE0F75|nr:hypothetical protein [Kribbella sp. CA-293567]WBQ03862.1 hypothetical protein OX958_28315 [Kribbella sp. CA-293567]